MTLPDRKVLAGGLGGVVTWLIILLAQYAGVTLPPDVQAAIPGLIAIAIAHLVPPARQDIVKNVDNEIVKLANADPNNPTTAVVVTEAQSAVQAQIDVATGAVPAAVANKTT